MKQKDCEELTTVISVIIPVYNVQNYLPRCLESILGNSYRNLEIICIDDGSTDDCLRILQEYERKDSRIRVFAKENRGVSSARNEGLKHCTGELVAFVDSDDWIHKDYFAILLKQQQSADYDVVVCNYNRTSEDSVLEYDFYAHKSYLEKDLNREEYISLHVTKSYVWGRLYKRISLEGVFFDEQVKTLEDVWFNAQFASRNPNMKGFFIDVPLYGYYIRTNSLVTTIDRFCKLKLAEKYYYCVMNEIDNQMKDILCLEALKKGLAARYDFYVYREKVNAKICQELLKDNVVRLKKNKMIYMILVCFPWIYRLYRIIDDPTMLKYEKTVRKALRK